MMNKLAALVLTGVFVFGTAIAEDAPSTDAPYLPLPMVCSPDAGAALYKDMITKEDVDSFNSMVAEYAAEGRCGIEPEHGFQVTVDAFVSPFVELEKSEDVAVALAIVTIVGSPSHPEMVGLKGMGIIPIHASYAREKGMPLLPKGSDTTEKPGINL